MIVGTSQALGVLGFHIATWHLLKIWKTKSFQRDLCITPLLVIFEKFTIVFIE